MHMMRVRPSAIWPLRWTVVLLLPLLLLPACSHPQPPEAPKTCRVPPGATQLDVDSEDSPETPWQRPRGEELVVYFQTSELSERYAGLAVEAAHIWSRSPCLKAVAMARCPEGANCVALRESSARRGDTDGEFAGHDHGGARQGGRITLYTRLLDRSSDNGALATIVHEMGHALGLVHRRNRQDVMNAYTDDYTDPVPDDIDFYNLAVIYGDQAQ